MATDTSGHGTNDVNAPDCSQAAAYEACRVFRDRLVSSEHTARFDSIMADTLRKHWRINLDLTGSIFATLGGPAAQLTAGKDAWAQTCTGVNCSVYNCNKTHPAWYDGQWAAAVAGLQPVVYMLSCCWAAEQACN